MDTSCVSRVNDIHTKKIARQNPRRDTPSYLHNLAPGECLASGHLFSAQTKKLETSTGAEVWFLL